MAHKNSFGFSDGRQFWTCSACGKEVQENDLICPNCRESLSLVEAPLTNEKGSASSFGGWPSTPAIRTYTGAFRGDGFELFGTILVNAILTILTLGIYAAWGKVKVYQFFYDNTEFAGGHFSFTGEGKEIFFGYLKAFAIFIGLYIVLFVAMMIAAQIHSAATMVAVIGWYLAFIYLIQYAMFSSRRYRFSRTNYRNIRFRLGGVATEFANESFKNLMLSIITLGFYLPIYFHRQFEYIYNRLYFGNAPFRYTGDEKEFYKIALPGFFLTLLTLGIYYFWWYPKMYNYYVQHLEVGAGKFHAEIQPGDYCALVLVNLLITVLTLGIGMPWVQVRTAKFFLAHLQLRGAFDVDRVVQVEQQAVSAGGEGLVEALDMDVNLGF